MDNLGNLSKPAKAGAAGGAGAAVLAVGVGIGSGRWLFLIILLGLLVVILGAFLLWTAWRRKRQARRLGGELQQHSTASPRTISDPGKRARLDDLRKKFEQGVQEYRSRGKDLYSLPWYVVVGEPGSGKTEAIRHSNVGFPPGMQDEFQGVGGTINMNWWFTNQAVILDTAGRLMFEEVAPGDTSEWKEFLTLLKKNRATCPINGLFLVIPSDSLITNTSEQIAAKAGKIARQLDVIQRTLDIRFPVFVIVTKCDKVNGFREFFDGITDPHLQHQMLGWANPDPLDAPFRPELVERHLDQVGHRLRRRRLGLLRDPIPENPEGRRCDEVDALYALPHSLLQLGPRLRRYLETIFVAGEWSAKPLFLRGIFFTSSMREGAALDAELASVIGIPVDALPEGKVWDRERAYFLRDLFMEKVFREKGLVTRATNTAQMLRRRRLAMFGSAATALLVFLGIMWLGARAMKGSAKDRSDFWKTTADVQWQDQIWKQPIIPLLPGGGFADYATNQVMLGGVKKGLGEFHASLRDQAEQPLKGNALLAGPQRIFNENSRTAQRVLFETGVIKPLLDATQQKFGRDPARTPDATARLADALATLLRLEAATLGSNRTELTQEDADKFLTTLLGYATSGPALVEKDLARTMVRTYAASSNPGQPNLWPPLWTSGGRGANSLEANPRLRAGLNQFVQSLTNTLESQVTDLRLIIACRDAVQRYADEERALAAAAQAGNAAAFQQRYAALSQVRSNMATHLTRVRTLPFLQGTPTLSNLFVSWKAATTLGTLRAIDIVRRDAEGAAPVFASVQQSLTAAQRTLESRLQLEEAAAAPERLPALDATVAGDAYVRRGKLYDGIMSLLATRPFADKSLIAQAGAPLDQFLKDKLERARAEAAAYTGDLKETFTTIAAYAGQLVDQAQRRHYLQAYLDEAGRRLRDVVAFPLVTNSTKAPLALDKFKELTRVIGDVASIDLPAPPFQIAPFKDDPEWNRFKAWIGKLSAVARAVLDQNRDPLSCQVALLKYEGAVDRPDWRFRYYNVRLGEAGPKPKSWEASNLGTVGVHEKFYVELLQRQDDAQGQKRWSGEWGPIEWLVRYGAKKADAAGRVWQISRPVDLPADEGLTGSLPLKLTFEESMPAPDLWPGPAW